MTLDYLLFDYSEGGDDTGSFDAMAAVLPAQAPTVEAEIAQVLAWAEVHFPDHAPVEDGGDWLADLQCTDEADGSGALRRVFSLSISGSATFCQAFQAQFGDAVA